MSMQPVVSGVLPSSQGNFPTGAHLRSCCLKGARRDVDKRQVSFLEQQTHIFFQEGSPATERLEIQVVEKIFNEVEEVARESKAVVVRIGQRLREGRPEPKTLASADEFEDGLIPKDPLHPEGELVPAQLPKAIIECRLVRAKKLTRLIEKGDRKTVAEAARGSLQEKIQEEEIAEYEASQINSIEEISFEEYHRRFGGTPVREESDFSKGEVVAAGVALVAAVLAIRGLFDFLPS